MMYQYYFTRDIFSGRVHVNFLQSEFQNLDAFLAMASDSALQEEERMRRER